MRASSGPRWLQRLAFGSAALLLGSCGLAILAGKTLQPSSIIFVLILAALVIAVGIYLSVSEPIQVQVKFVLAALVLLGVAAAALVNVVQGISSGVVYFRSDWVYADTEPIRFYFVLGGSFICLVAGAVFGALLILGSAEQRRFLERLRARPSYEDPSHVWPHKPD